jgi:hypothetical protein
VTQYDRRRERGVFVWDAVGVFVKVTARNPWISRKAEEINLKKNPIKTSRICLVFLLERKESH